MEQKDTIIKITDKNVVIKDIIRYLLILFSITYILASKYICILYLQNIKNNLV